MQFIRIPEPLAPLGGPLVYSVAGGSGSGFEVRIADAEQPQLYGVKRFAATAEATFDAAPYLRRALTFTPSSGASGLCDASGRRLAVVVQVTDLATRRSVEAPVRIFLPAAEPAASADALLTAMPRTRLLPEGGCDELTLLTSGPLQITLTIAAGTSRTTEIHRIETAGLHLFRIDTGDYPHADAITVDAGLCGTVHYAIVPPVEGAVRVAWRSRAGSVEHYDFPVGLERGVTAAKQLACGPDGYVSRTSPAVWCRKVRSALERHEVLDALAELVVTPEVWVVDGGSYTPAVVTSERAAAGSRAMLGSIDLEIRPKTPIAQPWNC